MKTPTDQHWSSHYERGLDFRPVTTADVDLILSLLPSPRAKAPATALDIGSGTGQLTRELWHRGFRVLGIDASSIGTKMAKAATVAPTSELRYLHRDFEKQPLDRTLPFAPFDLITCRLVYAFIKNKGAFIKGVSNVLAPGGVFVIISPLPDHVPDGKKGIATDPDATRATFEEHFDVSFSERDGLGTYVCRA